MCIRDSNQPVPGSSELSADFRVLLPFDTASATTSCIYFDAPHVPNLLHCTHKESDMDQECLQKKAYIDSAKTGDEYCYVCSPIEFHDKILKRIAKSEDLSLGSEHFASKFEFISSNLVKQYRTHRREVQRKQRKEKVKRERRKKRKN